MAPDNRTNKLTVRLLVAGAGTGATELLGLASAGISHQQSSIVLDEHLLDRPLGGLVNVWSVQEKNRALGTIPNPVAVKDKSHISGSKQPCPWRSPGEWRIFERWYHRPLL